MSRLREWLLLVVALAPAASGAAYRVTTSPAWNGLFRPGAATGLALEVRGETGGLATLRIDDGRLPQTYHLDLAAQRAQRIATVVFPPSDGTLHWTLQGAEGLLRNRIVLRPVPPGRALVADLAETPRQAGSSGPLHVAVDPARLPAASEAWEALGGVRLDRGGLARLSPGARRAFGDWLAGCGAVSTDDPALLIAITALAGCAGAALAGPGATLQPRAPSPLAAAQLEPLFARGPPVRLAAPLAGFLVLYLAALWLLRHARAVWLLTLPLAAAGLAGVTWSASRGVLETLTWDEQPSGAAHAARTVLWRHHAGGPGWQAFAVDEALPRPLAEGAGAALQFGGTGPRLVLEGALLQATRLGAAHRVPVTAAPRVTWHERRARVRNTGSSALPASRLFAGGGFVAVPALAPGAAWESAPDTARQAPGNAAERLLATRAAPAALLLHVAPHHWRAIHAEPEP